VQNKVEPVRECVTELRMQLISACTIYGYFVDKKSPSLDKGNCESSIPFTNELYPVPTI
jgi:hypothetical protein